MNFCDFRIGECSYEYRTIKLSKSDGTDIYFDFDNVIPIYNSNNFVDKYHRMIFSNTNNELFDTINHVEQHVKTNSKDILGKAIINKYITNTKSASFGRENITEFRSVINNNYAKIKLMSKNGMFRLYDMYHDTQDDIYDEYVNMNLQNINNHVTYGSRLSFRLNIYGVWYNQYEHDYGLVMKCSNLSVKLNKSIDNVLYKLMHTDINMFNNNNAPKIQKSKMVIYI